MPGEESKALVRRYFEDFASTGNLSVADENVAAEHVEGVKQLITRLHTAFPDFHMAIEDQIAEGDKVVTRFTASGTHQGIWQSPIGTLEPTGKRFQHEGIRIFRIVDGKLVETWLSMTKLASKWLLPNKLFLTLFWARCLAVIKE